MFKRLFIHLILAAGLLLISPLAGVRAQSGTTLLLLPEGSTLFLNNSKSINLAVLGGVDVNAFDVTLLYDPQVLALESWVYGDYLSSLARVYLKNEPGEFRLAATQLAQPGVNGDGVLLTFVFKGLGEGVSTLDITAAEFSSPTGVSTVPLTEDAILTVNGPTKTPTATVTASITPTATKTLTPTPSATATQTETVEFTATGTRTRTPTPTINTSQTNLPSPTFTATVSGVEAAALQGQTALPAGTLPPLADSANPAEAAPERSTAETASSGEQDLLFGIIAFETLDRILGATLILFVLVFTFLIALLTRRSSARNH